MSKESCKQIVEHNLKADILTEHPGVVLVTLPMLGRGYSTVCVTALAGATRTFRPQLRYQKKALDARIKINMGIELKCLASKVMTVCSSPRIL